MSHGKDPSEGTEKNNYRKILSAIPEGTIVTFNNSGGSNAKGTSELEVVSSGFPLLLSGTHSEYQVRTDNSGNICLYYNRSDSYSEPDYKKYDVIETFEVVAEN